MVALATGGVVIGGEFFLAGCKSKDAEATGAAFSNNDIAFLATTELFIESGNVYIETKRNMNPYIAFLMHPCVVVWRENKN